MTKGSAGHRVGQGNGAVGLVFRIEQAFVIPGRGPVVIGQLEQGTIQPGQHVHVVRGEAGPVAALVAGVEDVRALDEHGRPRPVIGVRLADVTLEQLQDASLIVSSGTEQGNDDDLP